MSVRYSARDTKEVVGDEIPEVREVSGTNRAYS